MLYLGVILALGVLTAFFNVLIDDKRNPNQQPFTQVEGDVRRVVLERNPAGHYLATGKINGQKVVFLVDTGATSVAVPAKLADRLGLQQGPSQLISTANGTATAYLTRLDKVELSAIVALDVPGTITPSMAGDEVLLGMSFLKDLEIRQQSGQLELLQQRWSP